MGLKKFIAAFIMPVICVAFLSSQSLVEVAKKEKERRAKIKKKSTNVVTNADLKKRKKSPSVSASQEKMIDTEESKSESKADPEERIKDPQQEKDTAKEEPIKLERFKQKYEQAEARVELLLQKMNGLWQKYNNPGDMTPKDRVQSEIAQTYLMLQKAQRDAAEAKEEWDAALSKKDR